MIRNVAAIASLALLACSAAAIAREEPPAASEAETLTDNFAFEHDASMRMTVPVKIDGQGPYQFLVDTGAERTVISAELADRLSLGAGASARVHSITEIARVDTVVIPKLKISARTVKGINAPALSRRDLGAEGMLGVDSLQSQRVLFDFKNRRMSVSPSRQEEPHWDRQTIVVKAKSKFGRLILADARAEGQKVWVIIDTGSQVTIGNEALRRKLLGRGKLANTVPIQLLSVTGGTMMADYTKIGGLKLGGVTLADMPIAFAEVHPFKKLGLGDKPALLLGMDALRAFNQVSVDFANRKVSFELPDHSALPQKTRLASLTPAAASVR